MNTHPRTLWFLLTGLAALPLAELPVAAAAAPTATATRPKLGVQPTVAPLPEATAAERLAQLRALIDAEATADQLEAPIKLTARYPWVDEHTYVYFERSDVNPDSNTARVSPGWMSYVGVKFRSAADRKYLVECRLRAPAGKPVTVFAIATIPGTTTYKTLVDTDMAIVDHSVFFRLSPKGIRDVEFAFFSLGEGHFEFHSCRVNPVKRKAS